METGTLGTCARMILIRMSASSAPRNLRSRLEQVFNLIRLCSRASQMDDSERDAVSEDGDDEVHTIETGSDLGNNGIIEKFIISLQTDSI